MVDVGDIAGMASGTMMMGLSGMNKAMINSYFYAAKPEKNFFSRRCVKGLHQLS